MVQITRKHRSRMQNKTQRWLFYVGFMIICAALLFIATIPPGFQPEEMELTDRNFDDIIDGIEDGDDETDIRTPPIGDNGLVNALDSKRTVKLPHFKTIPKHRNDKMMKMFHQKHHRDHDVKLDNFHRHDHDHNQNQNPDRRHHQRRPRVDDRVFRKVPAHCPVVPDPSKRDGPTKRREFVIKGERHTGTNWIRSIIEKNTKRGSIIVEQDSRNFGWKHGFLPPQGWGLPISDNEILVVITRDVFTWLPKMKQNSYDPIMNRKKEATFSKFIRAKYGALCQPLNVHTNIPSIPRNEFCAKFESWWFGPSPAEQAANLIQIRTQKYKQWLSNDPSNATFRGSKENFLKNRIHVRLESLTARADIGVDSAYNADAKELQSRLIGDHLLDRCVPVAETFKEVKTHTKFNGYKMRKQGRRQKHLKQKEFNANREKMHMLSKYSKRDVLFVLSQLDMEFEKQLGYDYSYIYEMLEEKG